MGGVISGAIVTGITNWLIGRKAKKEYLTRLNAANQEIMGTIRPSIAEKIFPPYAVIESLLRSTAEKHGVRRTDMLSVDAICNNIIKEIMDNAFLSYQQKKNFCELVTNLRARESLEHKSRHPRDSEPAPRRDLSHASSLAMGTVAAGISLFLAVRPDLGALAAGIGEQGRMPVWLGILGVTLLIPFANFVIFNRLQARRKAAALAATQARLQQDQQEAKKAVTNTIRKIRRAETRKAS